MDDFDDIQCEDYYGEEPEWITYRIGDGNDAIFRIVCENTIWYLKENESIKGSRPSG
tara:strand:- start:251 stop:421 length:171 start_codon:yes stop_codon:yes gene_type:complete